MLDYHNFELYTMAYALVKWIDENRVSVIPSSWVTKPSLPIKSGFPVDGECFWRKKTSIFSTVISGE